MHADAELDTDGGNLQCVEVVYIALGQSQSAYICMCIDDWRAWFAVGTVCRTSYRTERSTSLFLLFHDFWIQKPNPCSVQSISSSVLLSSCSLSPLCFRLILYLVPCLEKILADFSSCCCFYFRSFCLILQISLRSFLILCTLCKLMLFWRGIWRKLFKEPFDNSSPFTDRPSVVHFSLKLSHHLKVHVDSEHSTLPVALYCKFMFLKQ